MSFVLSVKLPPRELFWDEYHLIEVTGVLYCCGELQGYSIVVESYRLIQLLWRVIGIFYCGELHGYSIVVASYRDIQLLWRVSGIFYCCGEFHGYSIVVES